MKLVILLFFNSVWAENQFLWSLCSRNDSQWTKHRTADKDFNFVKSWIQSIHLNSKCPSKEYKVISYGYENSDSLELMTRIDNETGMIDFGFSFIFLLLLVRSETLTSFT